MASNSLTTEKIRKKFRNNFDLCNLSIDIARVLIKGGKVHVIEQINQETRSLEQPIGDDEDKSTFGEFIPDDKILRPDQEASRRMLQDAIRSVLEEISPKEKRILEMRYGLIDGVQHTLEEVGKEFGVTRERIRQIEAKVHEKLRQNDRIQRLRNYFD
jgi:RNA polymerase primary sigma factor